MTGKQYVEQLREQWGESSDGSEWEEWLARKVEQMHEDIRNWSYCMDLGMKESCPEKVEELCDMLLRYGIAPYSMRSRG